MHAFLDLYDSLIWVSVADGRRSQAYAVRRALSGDKRKSDDEQYRQSVKPYKCRLSSEHASNSSYGYTAVVGNIAELCGWGRARQIGGCGSPEVGVAEVREA